jgi:hypothetical protein
MIKWLIKKNWSGEQQCGKLCKLKGAVAEEVGSKSYNEIFCHNANDVQLIGVVVILAVP